MIRMRFKPFNWAISINELARMLMIAARVWRIMWATTTIVSVRQGKTIAWIFSQNDIWSFILEILGKIINCTARRKIRM